MPMACQVITDLPLREPHEVLLAEAASLPHWRLARAEALRSPMTRYGVGAVLLNSKGELLSKGCSHTPAQNYGMASIHAEAHALSRAKHLDLRGAICLVYTLNRKRTGCAHSSKPCQSCAELLVKRGVAMAVYARRDRRNRWQLEFDQLENVLDASPRGDSSLVFARHLKR